MVNIFKTSNRDFNLLWINDAHLDSSYCNRNKLKKDMFEADYIVISGDFLDLMQGRTDPRRGNKDSNLGELDYINTVMDMAVEILKPIRNKIIQWNVGNHEFQFSKFYGFVFHKELFKRLNISPLVGGMNGYLVMKFNFGNNEKFSEVIYYTHNSGWGGKRSKGALGADILIGERPSADIIIAEHIHKGVIVPLKVEALKHNFNIVYKTKYYIQGSTYKASDEDKTGLSFPILKGHGLSPIGGILIRFKYKNRGIVKSPLFTFE